MKRPVPPSALDRLREAFRPPASFGVRPGPSAPRFSGERAGDHGVGAGANGRDRGGNTWGRDGADASCPSDAGDPAAYPANDDRPAADGSRPSDDGDETTLNEPEADIDDGRPPRDETAWPVADRLRNARFDPGVPGVRVLAVVGALAALTAGVFLWWSRPSRQPVPAPAVRPAARPITLTTASAGAEATPSPSPSTLMVDVTGKVRHPGVVSVATGARVIDAIEQAGGLRPGAKTGTLNLARRVTDGEQILVGVPAPPDPGPPGSGGMPNAAAPATPIDLNAATAAQLDQLPGVGPVLAQRIVDYRTQHGGFRSIDELRQVSGIGEAKFADVKALVRV